MKTLLTRLINHEQLTQEEARNALFAITEGRFNDSQIAVFLAVFMMRSIALEELKGFQEALLELAQNVSLSRPEAIDLCGTGGDGKNTFNISTLAAFVTAGAGVPVAKHGNYGVSSVSGSSNVLEYLGIAFSASEDFLNRCLEQANICILHAPLFHPAMKAVGPIRKALGVKTFFNMLGPLVNPARPKNQIVGVFNLELARLYGYLYQQSNTNYSILHSLDGYDEVSLTSSVKVLSKESEACLTPTDFGFKTINPRTIYGGNTVAEAAQIFTSILEGNGTQAQENVVCANAALAIATVTKCALNKALQKAKDALQNKKALACFNKLQTLSKDYS